MPTRSARMSTSKAWGRDVLRIDGGCQELEEVQGESVIRELLWEEAQMK